MRILFVTLEYFPGYMGGADVQARRQAEELARRGHTVTVLCPNFRGLPSGDVNGVRVRRLRIDSPDKRGFFAYGARLARTLIAMRNEVNRRARTRGRLPGGRGDHCLAGAAATAVPQSHRPGLRFLDALAVPLASLAPGFRLPGPERGGAR